MARAPVPQGRATAPVAGQNTGLSGGEHPAPRRQQRRIGYATVCTRTQDHKAQLQALAGAHCREILVESVSPRDARPQLQRALDMLRGGDTLVVYRADRVARSMKELFRC